MSLVPVRHGRRPARPAGLLPLLVATGAGLTALVWIAAALITAGHGFNTSDEGNYLLSYRWWDTDLYTYTGAQYFYGPVFQLPGYAQTTAAVPGVPALSSLRLDPTVAAEYAELYNALRPYIIPPGRPIMAFDEMPGLVLLLDGRSVGEAWYSATDHERTAAGIRKVCAASPPWWGDRAPILLFNTPVTGTEIAALESCDLTFATDYQLLAHIEQTYGLQVYVPTGATDGHT